MTDVISHSIDLDDPTVHQDVDKSDMHGAIVAFPDQLRKSVEIVSSVDFGDLARRGFSGICVCGMGGSAIGADLARALHISTLPIPLYVNRHYRLPEFVDDTWLVIASSYSGNTEETLAAIVEAQDRECPVVSIATGGRLAKLSDKHGWPLLKPEPGLQPRAAVGYSLALLLLTLEKLRLVSACTDELSTCADFLESRAKILTRESPEEDNPAKQAAGAMLGKVVTIYGSSDLTDAVALRIKGQINENAKAHAFANVCPEYNHNEIMGWDADTDLADRFAVIHLLSANDEHEQVTRRQKLVRGILADHEVPVGEWTASGDTPMKRMLSLVQLGDFTSYHLAILREVDPTPVEAIEYLKSKLGA